MVVVATRLDASTERIIHYLNTHASIAINAVFFSTFEDGGNQYLSRAWMIAPEDNRERAVNGASAKLSWNGEYYLSFGDNRPWDNARQLGFIAGGGALWYSRTLAMLSKGDRVWVNIPKTGFVGVVVVTGERVRADQARFETRDGSKSLDELQLHQPYPHVDPSCSDDDAEYLVPVEWEHTVDRDDAVNEAGLFGNQNTVCKPKTPKWNHTVERLRKRWGLANQDL